jgi:hypothetical protein
MSQSISERPDAGTEQTSEEEFQTVRKRKPLMGNELKRDARGSACRHALR